MNALSSVFRQSSDAAVSESEGEVLKKAISDNPHRIKKDKDTIEKTKRCSARLSLKIHGKSFTFAVEGEDVDEPEKEKKKRGFIRSSTAKRASKVADQLLGMGLPLEKEKIEELYLWVKPTISKMCKRAKSIPFNLLPPKSLHECSLAPCPSMLHACTIQCYSKNEAYLIFDPKVVPEVILGSPGKIKIAIKVWNLIKSEEFAYLMSHHNPSPERSDIEALKNEVRLIPQLNKMTRIVKNYRVSLDNYGLPVLVNELYKSEDLFKVLNSHLKYKKAQTKEQRAVCRKLTKPEREEIFLQIIESVEELHRAHIIHRDLKPENILVDLTQGFIRVAPTDFGYSCYTHEEEHLQKLKGSLPYLAPENLLSEIHPEFRPQSLASDMYGVGLLGYLLFKQCITPWHTFLGDRDFIEGYRKMVRYSLEKIDKTLLIDSFLHKLLNYLPNMRPTASEALKEFKAILKVKQAKRAKLKRKRAKQAKKKTESLKERNLDNLRKLIDK